MNRLLRSIIFLLWVLTLMACLQKTQAPRVTMVYPSSEVVPDNLLRMYVQFSQPMKTVGNLERIKLMDQNNQVVEHVFFNNVHELWNNQQTQLTLIVDPARVKTGLRANEALGHVLQPNQSYTLVIEGLEDVNHQIMTNTFRKKFFVASSDEKIPDVKNWELSLPQSNTKDPMTLDFPQVLDYNSLQQRILIADADYRAIAGTISIQKGETQWKLAPKYPWNPGQYFVYVNARLEDPAGNNLNGLFDHKSGSLRYEREGVVEKIPFTINE